MAASDVEIERCLRAIVRKAIRSKDDITVNLARSRAESQLGLDLGFFKASATWKDRSKDLINATFDEDDAGEFSSPQRSNQVKTVPQRATEAGSKRKSPSDSDEKPEKPETQKRQKRKTAVKEDDQPVTANGPSSKSKALKSRSVARKPIEVGSEDERVDLDVHQMSPSLADSLSTRDTETEDASPATKHTSKETGEDGDDSDLSSLIDEPPSQKRKKRAIKSSSPKAKKSSNTTKAAPTGKGLSPDEETIKALQSQLLKCGVRKLWHRELAPYGSAKEKIRHLKSMLEEVGMTGRFSAEKAKKIKEARELAADLESAKAFEEQWGTEGMTGRGARARKTKKVIEEDGSVDEEEDDEEDDKEFAEQEATRKRLPKGLVDFGDSGDEGND